MTPVLWAPLVFGRTFYVDFRLLAVPRGTSREDLDWMVAHIQGTTAAPDDLREGCRWSLFKNERLCVIGLTCMATQLDFRHVAVGGRDLYQFVGYVTRVDRRALARPYHAPLPSLRELDREPYALLLPLYEPIHRLWQDERTAYTPAEFAAEIERPFQAGPAFRATPPVWMGEDPVLNDDALQLLAGPMSAAEAWWWSATRYEGPISFCTGLPDRATALAGPFVNACTRDSLAPAVEYREAPPVDPWNDESEPY